jgi:phosphate transport system substrate-binding protein
MELFHPRNQIIVSLLLFAITCLSASLGQSEEIRIDGSSTVFPISQALGVAFEKQKRTGVNISVSVSGTTGGFRRCCHGETDISAASRPIFKNEILMCKRAGITFHEIPIAFDAITVVVNRQNDWVTSFTKGMLKKIWEPEAQNKITVWNQLNDNWPKTPLKLLGPGAESGTFDYFTEAIVGRTRSSRRDFFASEDDNVLVRRIAAERNTLGYYLENQERLRAIPIDGGAGPVMPSVESVRMGAYKPLSRPIFIYVNHKLANKPLVREFVEFYLKSALDTVLKLKYVSLPRKFYELNLQNFKRNRLGTVFNGQAEIGMTIESLFEREAKF